MTAHDMATMDATRKARAERIFLDALDLASSERAALLTGACGDDADLLREVRLLLRAHEAHGILD